MEKFGKVLIAFGPTGIVSAAVDKATNTSELHQLTLQHSADDPFIRNFLVSSAEIFCLALKEHQKHFPHTVPQETVAAISRMYRGLLLELIRLFEGNGDKNSGLLYSNLEFVWNFCEIMFLASNIELPVLPYIKDWIKANFDDAQQVVSEFSSELPDLDSESTVKLWNVIFKLIFHGRTQEAAKYLILINPDDSAVAEERISLMAELLRKKPEYDPLIHSVTDFEQAWNLWRDECENRLNQGAFNGHDQLIYICKILIGDEHAFFSAREIVDTWYEYLCMKLAYKYPTARPSMLKDHTIRAFEELNISTEDLSPMERVLLSAMDYNIVSVLRDMQLHWNYPWFTLHFADLVYCVGQFSHSREHQVDSSSVGPLRNEFILDFATTLMQHPTLWQVGVKYLEAIPDRGGWPVIRECIQRKKCLSDFEAQKIISVAERFGFSREIHSICKENSLRKLKYGQMQNALLWSIKAGDGPLTTYILDRILFEGNCEIEPSVLESLRNAIPCADRLLFLSGFCDFRKMMECQDYRGAISQLCHLIKENLIPNRMAHKIMLNIQHFNDPNIKMETWQTTTLMEFLHTHVDPKTIGEDVFRQLNVVLMCHRAQGIIRTVSKVKKNG